MGALALVRPLSAPQEVRSVGHDQRVTRILDRIEPGFLDEIGWNPRTRLLQVPAAHPLLGWRVCTVLGCGNEGAGERTLCASCRRRWHTLDGMPFEAFAAQPWQSRRVGVELCHVAGCTRPWHTARCKLCSAHLHQRKTRGLTLEEFLADPGLKPLASWGQCSVVSCIRDRDNSRAPYCRAHASRLARLKAEDGAFDEERWQRTADASVPADTVSFRGLAPLVEAELLLALCERSRRECKTPLTHFRRLSDYLRACQAESLAVMLGEHTDQKPSATVAQFGRMMAGYVEEAFLDPETERLKTKWNAMAFGHRGSVDFEKITQPWLRQAVMRWAVNDLPRRRGKGVACTVQNIVNAVARLSESLRANRDDAGVTPGRLGRADIENFLNRLALLESRGDLTAYVRYHTVANVAKVLRQTRALGLTRRGEAMAGLGDDFCILREDAPAAPARIDEDRDLPPEIMQQLCAALPGLEGQSSREVRVAVELLIDTGRRPDEICELAWDCLGADGEGKPELIYDNLKEHRQVRRLPIATGTAELIRTQQAVVREQFPDAPIDGLKLLPSSVRNPRGRRAVDHGWVTSRHQAWVQTLPLLYEATIEDEGGMTAARTLPYDRAKVVPYAYRHCYAQRHADAGVPIDVLRELLDHERLDTLRCYYRVGEKRRREAVDRVTQMQFDRHGNRIWREARALLDSERARHGLEEIAVGFGRCTEPTNVQAGGGACPLRNRCPGCDHFNTDVSYLPDLEAYLGDLLRSREKILAMAADDWAKQQAMPTEQEISRIRRLIGRVKDDLDALTPDERAQIQNAITVVRKTRQIVLGMPRVRQPLPDVRPGRPA